MKVLHINSYYSGSSFYKNLYDKQLENELDIDVFVPVPSSFDTTDLALGQYTNVSVNHKKYDRIFFYLKHNKIYKDVKKQYKINDYSVIHAHSLFSNGYIALKLKQDYGIPYIVAVRNTDVNIFFKYMISLRKLGVEILKQAEKIIFLSESYKDRVIGTYIPLEYQEEISNKVEIIPNGIDDFWFENKGLPKKCDNKTSLNILYVGVVNRNKNIETSLEAIKLLNREGYDVKFTIVGRVEQNKIYQRFKDLSYVNYINPKSKEELLRIYRNNDIFLMPSKTETFGLVYAEAISQGLPIVYSSGQGFDKQFVEGDVGFSVAYNKPKEIYLRILDIANNDYEGMSENCLKKVKKFKWSNIAETYYGIYLHVL